MNKITVSTPYDIIIQQQIDIISKQQKDVLSEKEGISISDLHESIAQLQNIRNCIPNQYPFCRNVYGGMSYS